MAQSYSVNLGAFDMVLADDFANGPNYMNKFYPEELLQGHRITRGENYTLTIKFTVSRDLEQPIEIGLCGFGPPGGWNQLSWEDTQRIFLYKIENVVAGREYSATVPLNVIKNASGAGPIHNGLVILTQGKGQKRRNGGEKGPATISFTEFVFSRE